jgi:adenylyltransferase/sulfurtransferase
VAVPEITVEELKRARDQGEDLLLVDVRQPDEFQHCNLGGLLIPLAELPQRLREVDPTRDIVVLCRSGMRSAQAVGFLRHSGYPRVRNVAGGILAWSDRIDPTVPKY